MRGGFTLAEVIIVVVIIGILATLAVPNYIKAVERTRNKEAISMLKLIQQAEKMYRLENNGYVACNSNANCNNKLKLNLPSGGNWDYKVTNVDNNSKPPKFTAKALRNGLDKRTWSIDQDDKEPICSPKQSKYCE
ncbi:MAG: prepilin-type N-terminal cleavage/methylation domain-containing protein [Candidatus Omnitrophica bacterium]|nr:prepilin-type N-terminal cleavage/methylation domain-containing protein [Candidatus Omnitrophota bacterium]